MRAATAASWLPRWAVHVRRLPWRTRSRQIIQRTPAMCGLQCPAIVHRHSTPRRMIGRQDIHVAAIS